MNPMKDYYTYKLAKEEPMALAYILNKYHGIEIMKAYSMVREFIQEVEKQDE